MQNPYSAAAVYLTFLPRSACTKAICCSEYGRGAAAMPPAQVARQAGRENSYRLTD